MTWGVEVSDLETHVEAGYRAYQLIALRQLERELDRAVPNILLRK